MRKLALLLFLVVLTGCSKNTLDKKAAAEMIQKVYDNAPAAIFPYVGRVGSNCVLVSYDGKPWPKDLTPAKDPQTLVLQAIGYATVTPDGPGFWKVELTDSGKAHHHGSLDLEPTQNECKPELSDFFLATRDVVKAKVITGDENTASVEYTWRWKSTELGQALRKDGKAYAALSPDQRESLGHRNTVLSPSFPIPAPEENDVITGTATFAKDATGWHPSK